MHSYDTLLIFALVAAPLDAIPHAQCGGDGGNWWQQQRWPQSSSTSQAAYQPAPSPLPYNGGGQLTSPLGRESPTTTAGSYLPTSRTGTSTPSTNSTGSSSGLGISSSCFKPNGIAVGWLPDGVDMTSIESNVSSQGPCTYGNYAQITDANSMPDSQIQADAAEAAKAGAVYNIALQPWIPFSQVNAQPSPLQ